MTKTQFNETLKGFHNSSTQIEGVTIANVAWKNEPWMIIENGETFEDAKQDNFTPIQFYRTREDLYNAIYKGKTSTI